MSDGSEAGEGVDFLGIEIPEHMDMRSCPGYTNQELSSFPFPHPPAPRMLQGDSWYLEEVPGPREWLKSGPNSWLYVSIADPKYNAFPPNEDPLMDRGIQICVHLPSLPPQHLSLAADLQ